MTAIRGPLETTDLLFVSTEGGGGVEGSEVMVNDHGVSSPRGESRPVPGEGADAGHVVSLMSDLMKSVRRQI